MQKKYEVKCPKMTFNIMDVTKMTFKPNEFDFILDKGTLDCLACGENATQQIEKYI